MYKQIERVHNRFLMYYISLWNSSLILESLPFDQTLLFFSACNCYRHSTECYYDPQVAHERRSIDIYGQYEGGGVCQNCQHNTAGINCNQCDDGYYRPDGRQLDSPYVCESKFVFLIDQGWLIQIRLI